MTVGGAVVGSAGLLMFIKGLESYNDWFMLVGGAGIYFIGGVSVLIGIPIWIIGGSQKSQIEIALVKFKDTSYVPSFGLKITF